MRARVTRAAAAAAEERAPISSAKTSYSRSSGCGSRRTGTAGRPRHGTSFARPPRFAPTMRSARAAGCLAGYDARVVKEFKDFGAASLAFDRDGQRLLIGAVTDPKRFFQPEGINRWPHGFGTPRPGTMTIFSTAAMGPVAFRGDGTPVQLVPGTEKDGTAAHPARPPAEQAALRFMSPGGATFDPSKGDLTLTPDASVVAAVLQRREKGQVLMAWDGTSGRTLGSLDLDIPVRCIAVSPTGRWSPPGRRTAGSSSGRPPLATRSRPSTTAGTGSTACPSAATSAAPSRPAPARRAALAARRRRLGRDRHRLGPHSARDRVLLPGEQLRRLRLGFLARRRHARLVRPRLGQALGPSPRSNTA